MQPIHSYANMNKYTIILLIGLTSFTAGCATISKKSLISAQKEIYLKDVCDQNGVYWQWDHVSQVATLVYRGVKAEVLVGSDLVIVDKERVTLSAPVRVVRSAVIVPIDFQSKVIDRDTIVYFHPRSSVQTPKGGKIVSEINKHTFWFVFVVFGKRSFNIGYDFIKI